MGVKGGTTKRRRRTNDPENRKQREDRLSSLPDHILIEILSRLPLPFAIVTGSLSWRWRGLWKKVTSINLSNRRFEKSSDFLTAFNNIMMQIKSPFIHSFSVELGHLVWYSHWKPSMDSWLDPLGDRNVRELKVTWPDFSGRSIPTLPRFIFQMQSLVSVELNSKFDWQLPDQFNLPNLKTLSVTFCLSKSEWLEKLIKACPSLEELSLNCVDDGGYGYYFECSNQNLRRLIINMGMMHKDHTAVIYAPKIEYLAVRSQKHACFCFDEEPIVLREAKIEIIGYDHALSDEKSSLMTKFYGAISNVGFLVLDVFALENVSTVFHYATRVTLDMKVSHDIQTVVSFLELCPVLDVLTLKFCHTGKDYERWILPKPSYVNTLRGVLKRIDIEINGKTYCKPVNFFELIEYLLSNALDLAHFKYNLSDCQDCETGSVGLKQRRELKLCKLLYQCPMASVDCEVEFEGRYFKMSRKAGPKVQSANGEIIPFSCSL